MAVARLELAEPSTHYVRFRRVPFRPETLELPFLLPKQGKKEKIKAGKTPSFVSVKG
jgi:hypothetical protein